MNQRVSIPVDFLPNAAPPLAHELHRAYLAVRRRMQPAPAPKALLPPRVEEPPVIKISSRDERLALMRASIVADRRRLLQYAGAPRPSEADEAHSLIAVREIKRLVAAFYDIKVLDLVCQRRTRSIMRPRQIAMYLVRHYTLRSFPETGRLFGDRDHTTVMHAVEKVQELMAVDPVIAADVAALRAELDLIGKAA